MCCTWWIIIIIWGRFCCELNSDRMYSLIKWRTTNNVADKFLSMISDNFESLRFCHMFFSWKIVYETRSVYMMLFLSLSLSRCLFLAYMYTIWFICIYQFSFMYFDFYLCKCNAYTIKSKGIWKNSSDDKKIHQIYRINLTIKVLRHSLRSQFLIGWFHLYWCIVVFSNLFYLAPKWIMERKY